MSDYDTFRSSKNTIQFNETTTNDDPHFQKKLISLVKNAEPLYRRTHPDYNNGAKNRLEWVIIAEKCKKTVAECISAWHRLLRTYLSLPESDTWIHKSIFQLMEPFITHHGLQKPNQEQTRILLDNLKEHASKCPGSDLISQKEVWAKIVVECNAISPGVIMSCFNWKKYWFYLKQQLIKLLSTSQFIRDESISDVEESIIQICGGNLEASVVDVLKVLKPDEPGSNQKPLLLMCNKCRQNRLDIKLTGLCFSCDNRDVLCQQCKKENHAFRYNTMQWSASTLNHLPKNLRSNSYLSLCAGCANKLKEKVRWKMCRICLAPGSKSRLQNLFSSNIADLRRDIEYYFELKFKKNDGLPCQICHACVYQLPKIIEHIKTFQRNQDLLLEIHINKFVGDPAIDYRPKKKLDIRFIRLTSFPDEREKNQPEDKTQTIPNNDTPPPESASKIAIKNVFSLNDEKRSPPEEQQQPKQEQQQLIQQQQQHQQPKEEYSVNVPFFAFWETAETLLAEKKDAIPTRKPQKVLSIKPSTVCSKPAIFNISEFGKFKQLQPAPPLPVPAPVVAIPLPIKRPAENTIVFSSDSSLKVIKTEDMSDYAASPSNSIATSSGPVQPKLKIIKMDGMPVIVSPHPKIEGAYVRHLKPQNCGKVTVEKVEQKDKGGQPLTDIQDTPANVQIEVKKEPDDESDSTMGVPFPAEQLTATPRVGLRECQLKLKRVKLLDKYQI